MGLIEDVGAGPVGIDTAVFIYFIEEEPRFLAHILPLFEGADRGKRELVTSALTLLEFGALDVERLVGRLEQGVFS